MDQTAKPNGYETLKRLVSDQSLAALRWLTVAVFLGLFAYYIAITLHWGIIGDGATMHYIVFLIRHGKAPYAEIGDMNMPGAYLTEQWAMAIFGWGDLSWRIYEFFLLAAMTVSGMLIGGRRYWFAGIYAAAFFIAMHGADGPQYSLERDELMTVLLVAATAALLLALQRQKPILLLPYGLLAGLAASIKPTAILIDLALLALLFLALRKRRELATPYIVWGITGNALVALLVLGYLWHYHAIGSFIFILTKVLPAYAISTPHSFLYLLGNLFPDRLLRLLPFAIAAALLRKQRPGRQQMALLLGAAFGAISYFLQGKGYSHHRYAFVEFLLLWMGVELADAMRRPDLWSRAIGAAGVVVLLLFVLPHYVRSMHRESQPGGSLYNPGIPGNQLTSDLVSDLTHLGGDQLQGQVMCLDLVNSCLNSLYRLRLLENTSYTGDLLLFAHIETPLVKHFRDQFMDLQHSNPASVVVLNNQWFFESRSDFRKLDTWPLYKEYLETNYVNVVERSIPGTTDTQAYRIYLRKGSAALAYEQSHPLQ